MSVVKSKRGESNMEFLYTARLLQIYSIRKCVGFPKRYTFYVSQPIANAAVRVHENVKRGNSIYPANRHEAQMRRDYFIQAFAELQSMVSQIEAAAELFDIEPRTMEYWMGMVEKELRLIRSVMNRDRERYKELP